MVKAAAQLPRISGDEADARTGPDGDPGGAAAAHIKSHNPCAGRGHQRQCQDALPGSTWSKRALTGMASEERQTQRRLPIDRESRVADWLADALGLARRS